MDRSARILGVALIVLAAACATPDPTPSPSPSATPSPAATVECLEFIETAIPSTAPPRDWLDSAETVVVGTLERHEDAVWDTPDGSRPTREGFHNGAGLVTPLVINVERALRGDASAAAKAVESGGVSGCDVVDYGWPDLVAGERYVFLLRPLLDSTGAPSEHQLLLVGWPVDADDRVASGDGRLDSLAKIERRIRRTDGP